MKKLIALLCAVLLLGSQAKALEIEAPAALLMEKETGTILYA
jgi:D-alanyl-D-alanine carboxypeptidase (penicillin-binding protein 5/6)